MQPRLAVALPATAGLAALALAVVGIGSRWAPPAAFTVPRALAESRTRAGDNPFKSQTLYVNPTFGQELGTSMESAEGPVKATLESMKDVPSAYWLDTKAKIRGQNTSTMEGIIKDAAGKSPPHMVTFIVYDLPNRDCHAKASNGEICCTYKDNGRCDYTAAGDCAKGIEEYKKQYIDPIADVLRKNAGKVPVALIIEPDSLPNLATNMDDPNCGNTATGTAYKTGVPYAVKTLAEADPKAAIYLDAAHGGWLGWKNNMQTFVGLVKDLGVTQYLRGFAQNTANYQWLGTACETYDYCLNNAHPDAECCYDPCGLTKEWNPSNNEMNYALHLTTMMRQGITGFEPKVVIDTGRNGVADMRKQCKHWCNIRGAGAGLHPTTETANPDLVDAYLWLKTPGESDGCTEELPTGGKCPRFDTDCGSEDSIGSQPGEPKAPEAGQWFDYQVKQLAQNAHISK